MQSVKIIGKRGFAMLLAGLLAFAAFAALPVAAKADAASGTIPAGANPYSIVINPVTNKVYVANYGSNTVTVIDGATNTAAMVPTGAGPYAIAVNTVTNKIYVANYDGNSVTVIDGATDTAEPTAIQTGSHPSSIAVNTSLNKIYTADYGDQHVTVIDGATNAAESIWGGMHLPYAVAVNPVTNRVYVTDIVDCRLKVIDCNMNPPVISSIPLPMSYNNPVIAVNPVLNRIYVANETSTCVTVINCNDNSATDITTGQKPVAIAADPLTGKVYTANRNGNSVTVINPDNTSLTLPAGSSPSSVTVNPATGKIYVANRGSNSVTVIDGVTNTVFATVAVGGSPNAVAVNPLTGKVYTANEVGSVTVIDGDSNFTEGIAVVSSPVEAAVNLVTGKLYVANQGSNTVTVIDGKTHDTATVPVGVKPMDVAVNTVTNKIYVTNETDNSVTVINGVTNDTATVAVGEAPNMVEVNPATNRIYVVNKGSSNSVTVIDGATDTVTATVELNSMPHGLAVNPATNMIYVAVLGLNKVMAIDGNTNTFNEIPVCDSPTVIAVNPVTNKIYAASFYSKEVTVIDGVTEDTTSIIDGMDYSNNITVNTGANKVYVSNSASNTVRVIDGATNATASILLPSPGIMAVNPVTNKLYVRSGSNVAVVDCVSNTLTATVPLGNTPIAAVADPVTNQLFVLIYGSGNVTLIDAQNEQPGCLTTAISPLPHNATGDATPTFDFTASSAYAPNAPAVSQIWYQADTMTGPWQKADAAGSSASATLSALTKGTHILYAFATDGMDSTSINTYPAGGSIPGTVAAYTFTVTDYQVSVSANNAEYGSVTGGGTFDPGSEATLHAAPKTGYHFVRWTEGGAEVSTDADYTFDVLGMRMLTAEFAINQYAVNVSPNTAAYGTVTGGGTYNHGASVTLLATPETGCHFVRWTEGGAEVSTNAEYSFTAEKTRTLTAEFAVHQYTVNAAANNAAYGTITGAGTFDYGASVTLRAAAAAGCRFLCWTENDTEVSTSADYIFTVDRDKALTAVFEAVAPDVIPVTVSCLKTDVARYGACTGTIAVTASGGNSGAFLYSVDGGTNWQPSGSFANLAAGTYTAMARDAGNTSNISPAVKVMITQPKLAWTGIASKMPAKVKAGTAWAIKPAAKPRGYTLKSVRYASGNTGIAFVDKNGNVTFLKGGRVKLTVTSVFQNGKRLKTMRSVKYVSVTQLVSSITLNKTDAVLKVGKKLKLLTNINPYSATNKRVKWKSSNTRIATVSSSGVVKAKKAGTVVITCTAQDGSKVAVRCVITVK